MRIAMVVPGGVDRSGEYRVIPALMGLIERLARQHDVQVIALTQERAAAQWDLAGARIHNIGVRHTRRRAIATICQLHRTAEFDLVHAIWSGGCGLIAVAAAALLRRPSLVHVTGGEVVALRDIGYGGRLRWRGRLQEAVVLRCASVVTASSAPIVELLGQLGIGAQRLALGVAVNDWPAMAPRARDPSRPARLIHVASLNRVKDQTTLLQAMAALQRAAVDFELDVVGDDTLGGAVQAHTRALGLADRVRYRGFLTQRQLRPLMAAADLLVMSSRHEAGPMAMLEAAVVGVPTVGTAVGHIAECSPDAAIGVPVGDGVALARAIELLLRHDGLRLRARL